MQTQTNATGNLYSYYFAGWRSEEVAPGNLSKVSYFDAQGNPLSVTAPADAAGVQPVTTYGYTAYTSTGYPTFYLQTSQTSKISASGTVASTTAYNTANKYVPQTVVVDAGTGKLALATGFTFDAVGNLTQVNGPRTDVTDTVTSAFDAERRVTQTTDALGKKTLLAYDAEGRLRRTTLAGTVTDLAYDGTDLVAEYDSAGGLLRRYVHGPGVDEPLVWYEGTTTTNKTWLYADHLGSVVATANGAGTSTAIYRYGPYGEPNTSAGVRFRYTGQQYLGGLNLYHYKARFYSPSLGRFLQTDPIGTADDLNRYAYVGNNPVNFADPSGLIAADMRMLLGKMSDGFNSTSRVIDDFVTGGYGQRFSSAFSAGNYGEATVSLGAGILFGLGTVASGGEGPVLTKAAGTVAKEGVAIWSATKSKSAVENALGHWNKHRAEFPELVNSKQYVEAAHSLAAKPPADALIKSRGADTLIYDKATNTFLVKGPMGLRARCLGRKMASITSTGNDHVYERRIATLPLLRIADTR